jgi:hypothetical protein
MKRMKKREAELILYYMKEILLTYGCVTVADYYDLLGSKIVIDSDDTFGWRSLDDAKIKRKGFFKYVIVLPDPVRIS